jgi:hypothetical protein
VEDVKGKGAEMADDMTGDLEVGAAPTGLHAAEVEGGRGACMIMKEADHGQIATQQAPALLLWSPDFFESLHNAASTDGKGDEITFVAGPLGAQLVVG